MLANWLWIRILKFVKRIQRPVRICFSCCRLPQKLQRSRPRARLHLHFQPGGSREWIPTLASQALSLVWKRVCGNGLSNYQHPKIGQHLMVWYDKWLKLWFSWCYPNRSFCGGLGDHKIKRRQNRPTGYGWATWKSEPVRQMISRGIVDSSDHKAKTNTIKHTCRLGHRLLRGFIILVFELRQQPIWAVFKNPGWLMVIGIILNNLSGIS